MKLTQMHQSKVQRVVIYGAPKTGKTKLAAMLAQHYKILYIGLENGHTTMYQLPVEWQENIDVIAIPDSDIFPIGIETCLKLIKGDPCQVCVAHGKVSCPACTKANAPSQRVCLREAGLDTIVIFDSLTQLTKSAIAHITKDQPDTYKLQLDDWGNLRVLIEKFLSQVQVAPYNVICISHEEEVSFEDGTKKIVPVSGSSTSSRNTARYFDHVVYAAIKNKKHVFGSATDYAMSVSTGSRTGARLEDKNATGDASLISIFGLPPVVSETDTEEVPATVTQTAAATNKTVPAVPVVTPQVPTPSASLATNIPVIVGSAGAQSVNNIAALAALKAKVTGSGK